MDRTDMYLVLCVLSITGAMGLYRHTYSACYGITTDNFIKASCPGDDEKIVMDNVYAYAKPITTGCPEVMTDAANTPTSCCQYDADDCGFEYDGFNKNTYYENCHSRTSCSWTPVAWANAPCNTSLFPLRTSYMTVYFYCISENDALDVSEDGSVNTTTALLSNPGFESGNNTGALPANSSFKCSISASCARSLRLKALTLNFTEEGGLCGQSLTITDRTNTHVLTCDSNTDYLPNDLNIDNNTFYLEIQVNNTFGTDSGYFLLQIGDAESDDPITLACGASLGEGRTECSNITTTTGSSTYTTSLSTESSSEIMSNSTDQTTNYSSTTANLTGNTTTDISWGQTPPVLAPSQTEPPTDDKTLSQALGIGIFLGLLVCVLLVICVFRNKIKDFYVRKCKTGVHPDTGKNPLEVDEEITDENLFFAPFEKPVLPQVAPVSALTPIYQPHSYGRHTLTPINQQSIIHGKELETEIHKKTNKEKQKKKRKRKKNKEISSQVTEIDNLRSSIKSASSTKVDVAVV